MLKVIVETLDEVDEKYRDLYEEKKIGEKTVHVLKVEGVDAHPAITALKTAFERVKADKKKLTEDLRAATEKLATVPEDFDADEWAELKANAGDPKDRDKHLQQQREQYEARLAAAEKKRLEEVAAITAERDSERARANAGTINTELDRALDGVGVGKQFKNAARALLASSIEVVEEEGEHKTVVHTDLGDQSVADYVKNWSQSEEGKAFIPPAQGSGSEGSNRRQIGDKNPWTKQYWSKTEQGRLIRADRTKAERMAQSAGFADIAAASRASRAIEPEKTA